MIDDFEKKIQPNQTEQSTQANAEVAPQDNLKTELVSGEIDLETFRDKLIELDQQGDHTEQAHNNVELLLDPEVRDAILANPEHYSNYYALLSISYFHAGQASGNIDDFMRAHISALEVSDREDYDYWVAYTKGTWAFFAENMDVLQQAVAEIGEGRNKEILINLQARLEQELAEGGHISHAAYLDAYIK